MTSAPIRQLRPSLLALCVAIALVSVMEDPAAARIGYGPLSVDDASTLWDGTWEFSTGFDVGGGYRLENSRIDLVRVPAQLRWGWKDRLELGMIVPFAFQDASREAFKGSGLADVKGAIKYQMSRDEGGKPASSTELLLGWGPDVAVGSHAFSATLTYALSKTFGDGNSFGHLNLGYTIFTENRDDVFSWGGAYERKIWNSWRWSAGAHSGTQPIPGFKKDIVIEGGLTKQFSETAETAFALGTGITSEGPDWQFRLLFKKEFGRQAGAATPFQRGEWSAPPAPTAPEIVHRGEAAMRIGDYGEAIRAYQEALALDPNVLSAWNNMGIAHFKTGEPRKALESYEKALTIDPNNADIYFNVGLAHYRLGNLLEARRAFARTLELNPEHSLARSNLTSLGGITGR